MTNDTLYNFDFTFDLFGPQTAIQKVEHSNLAEQIDPKARLSHSRYLVQKLGVFSRTAWQQFVTTSSLNRLAIQPCVC